MHPSSLIFASKSRPRPVPALGRSPCLAALLAWFWIAGCADGAPATEVEGPPREEASCAAQDGPGTVHDADVTRDEVWSAEDGPHLVRGHVAVRAGAELVIEPCAQVLLAPDASLDVGREGLGAASDAGRLVARGEASRPITLAREGDGAWGSLGIVAPSVAELRHVRIVGGGSDPFREHAAVWVVGDGAAPSDGQLLVDHVEIVGAEGHGLVLVGAATFREGSRALDVDASGSPERPYPLVVGQHALDRLPDGDLTGNEVDEIWVREDLANGWVGLQTDATMRRRSVPYHLGGDDLEPFRIGSSSGEGLATLTIEAGVELRVHPGVAIRVLATEEGPHGVLRALGAPDAPVVFTSARATPSPGDWTGIYFEGPVADDSVLEHAEIAFAGGPCACSLVSCSPVDRYEAAVLFDGDAPATAFLKRSSIRASAGHGVLRSWLDHADVDFTADNTFEDVAGCAQTTPMLSDVVCPDTRFACEGG